jgi:hypothetical protein
VALSAATVIVASWLGLPVSSTHIVVVVYSVVDFTVNGRGGNACAAREAMPDRPVYSVEETASRKPVRRISRLSLRFNITETGCRVVGGDFHNTAFGLKRTIER